MKKITISVLVVMSPKGDLEERMHFLEPLSKKNLSYIRATVFDRGMNENLKKELIPYLNLRGFRAEEEQIKFLAQYTEKNEEGRMDFTVVCDHWYSDDAVFCTGNKFIKLSEVNRCEDQEGLPFEDFADERALLEFLRTWTPASARVA